MLTKLSSLFIVLTLLAFTHADLIQPVTRTPVRPFAINQGYETDYSFSIYIPSAISVNAYIEVEFPQPYQLPSGCKAYIKIGTGPFTIYSCSKPSYSKYMIYMGSIDPNEYTIVFEGVQNPTSYPASSNFKIKTYLNKIVLIDSNEFFDSVPFLAASGTSKNATIKNIGYTSVSLGSSYDFTFALKTPLAKGDSIKVNFPVGFYFVRPACFHRNSGTYSQIEVLHNNRSVICQVFLDSMATGVFQVVSIIGVVNPEYAGVFKNFYLETLEGTSANVYERISVLNYIQINPGNVTLSIVSASNLLALNTTHQFEFMFENDVPADGEVWIKIPPGFRYLAANCTLLRPIEAQPNGEVTCELAANKTGYIIRGFTGISASQTVTIKAVTENPPVATDYKIQVFSYSTTYNAMIDETFGYITIINQYGASKFFASHSLRWTRRLKHNEPGPLEFTFFLNIPLPSTASTFYGKIIVDIRPKLTLPPAPKSLRCFFYNTIPAQDCIWDETTYSNRTTVSIWTPVTDPYFQTEIPITITTEDSVGTYGILLPMLIQRYKFYFYFWRNGDTKEHEVYFEDYVPDPIELAASDVSLGVYPLQYGQEAYMELVWTNTYITLGTNYYIEFEFDHGLAGWDYNLGFAALPFYDRYELPCLVVNSLVTPAITDYKCYLNPGGSSTTNSTIQVLYIGAIPANTVMTVRLPKIKFGASGNANLRFTLYENTPGENTLRIPIVYKDFYFTPTTATGLATTALSVSLGAYQPDIDTTLTLTFAPSISSGPKYIIYEYPSLFVISTQDVACSSNECFVFTSAQVHWIVFYITNPQGATATTALTIHNPPYIGANTFKARTANAGPIGDLRQGSVTIVAGSLTVTFTREATLNPTETNKNSLIIFEVQTTTVTNIPLDGSIILTFTGLTVPDDDDFACQIVSGLTGQTTALGIICEKLSGYTNKIKIYNINAVTKVTALDIKVQLWTTTTTPVTCAIDTFYDRAATSTKLIDSGSGSLALTFNNVNFASSVIVNDHSGDFFRVGGYGALTLKVTPQHTASSQVTMTITFASGFTLSTTNNDIGYCKLTIGSSTTPVRRRCSVSTSPALTFTIPSLTSTDVTSGVPITLFLTTDYSNPLYKGIKAPSTVGYQVVTVTITDTTSTPTPAFTEVNSQHIYVYPQSIPKFQVTGTCASADYYTMFNFVFTLAQALNSNTDPTTRGRIYLEFPVGTGGFRTDLGTGQPTGGVVGCRVLVGGSLNTNIKCRLVQSPGNNLPAAVELVGFGAITASSVFTVTVARVKHVQTTLGELVFGLRTEHVLVLTGVITPIEYATYNLWHRVTANTPTTASPTTGATDVSFGASPYPNTLQVTMRPKIYSDVQLDSPSPTTDPGTDYYIYELPSDFVVTSTVNCPSSIGSSRCYTFPEIGWVVYEIAGGNSVTADSNTDGSFDYVTMPGAYYYAGYTFYAYVWKSNLYNHKMPHYIQASYITLSTVGTFPSASASITVATDQLTQNRANTEITVSFTTQSAIPSTGTIEIRFAAGVTPQPQCKNSPSMGSALTSSTGRVACSIQSNSWLITNFDNVAAGANIRIYGFVTLASTSGSYAVDLYSYSNQDTTSIATLGNTIDSLKSYLSISVNTYNTLSLDSMPSFLINSPAIAKASNYRPLIFYFTLNGMSLTASSGTIQITVLAASTNFLTSTAPNANLICSFMNPSSGAYTACSITSSGTTSGGNSYTTYTLTPLEDLSANTQYRGTITTVFAQNGLDGIQHPSVAATYQVSIIATQGGSQQADIDFFEIVPDKFSSLTVKNYVIAPSEEDVIDISLTTSSSIGTGDRIVVELPTLFNTTTLFANDLGLGLIDYQDKLCEVISPSGLTMSCFFQKGNSYAGTPASIVLYGFSAAVTSLRFAFTAKNPAVTSPTVLPLTIYSVSGTTPPFTKTYYETVERAIIVLPSSIMGTLSNNNQPSYTPTTVKSTTATLSITLTFSSTLGPNDYYALKVPQMGSSAPVASGTAASSIINGVAADYIVLPKNRFIILRPNSAVSSGVLVTVPNLYNPEQGLGSANLGFTGYASHFSTMAVEKITYSMNSADFTGLTSLSATAIIAASTSETSQKNTLTITINAIYQGIQSVIITVPSEFTLREDCYEGYNNAVVTYQCTTDSTNSRVYVTLESGTTYSSSAANLILTVLVTNSATSGTVSPFGFYLYTTTQTDPTVLQGQRYAVTSVSSGIALATTVTNAASPTFLEAEYVPYVENNLFYPTSTYGQIKFTATLQGAVTASSTTFKIYLPSILAFDTATAGDLSLTPAVILYSSSISGGYVLLTASYASGTLSCTSTVSLSSSTTVTFTITTIQQTGETVGIRVPTSAYAKTFFNVILEQTTGATTYTSQIGDLTVSSAPTYTATLAPMTKAASTVTAWEFTINFGGSSTIDNFYIDLPTIDDFGNSLFDTGLGVFTQDGSLVPCSSTSVSSGLVTPECTFYMGTSSRPARILVRGFSTGTNIVLYIAGIMNPAVNRRVYMNIRFYIGTTFNSMTNIVGYLTESASGVNSASGTVTGPVAYRPGTWSFNSGVTLSSTIVLVKLPSACTIGWLSGSQHFLTGSIGNYVLQKTSITPYTFNNFGCTAAATLGSFTQYHMTASTSGVSNGEIRTSSYGVSASTLQGSTTYALVSTIAIQSAIVSSNLYGQSAMAKLSFDISSLASKFTINSADYLGPGFIITIAFSNYYFASISKCQIFGGLTRISPNNPIQCSISGTTIAITNFGGVMSSGNYLQIQLSYTNSGNPYPSGTPTAVFNVYGSSTLESGSDFSAYASVTSSILSVDASYASGVSLWSFGTPSFPSPPAPGQTGITSINIAPSQFPSWTTSSDYIRIGFEKSLISNSAYCNVGSYTGYYTGCSIVSGSGSFDYVFISLTDGMSYGSGFPYSTTIDIYINWPVDSKNFFYDVAIVYGSSTSSYSYRYRSYSVTASIEKIDSMSVSTSQLHRVSNYLNEIHYQTTIPMAIDPSTTLLSFTYPSSYINVQSQNLTQIDCYCTEPAKCYNYNAGTSGAIDVYFDSSTPIPVGTTIDCYIPNVLQTGSFYPVYRIIDASSRQGYFTTTAITSLSVPDSAPGTHTLTVNYPSSPIYPYTSYSPTIQISSSIPYNSGDMAYLDFGTGGPLYTCGGYTVPTQCRYYSNVRTILVLPITAYQVASTAFDILNVGSLQFNYRHSDLNTNYTITSYVVDGTSMQSYTTTSTVTASTFSPETTNIVHTVVDGVLRQGLFGLQKLSFSTGTNSIPAINSLGVGGRIIITVSGIGNVPTPTSCYAGYTKIPITCSMTGSGTSYTIQLTHTSSVPASKNIEIFFRGTNPTSGNPTITLKGYSYYNPGNTNYAVKVLAHGTVTPPSYTAYTGTYVGVSNQGSLSFITKTINPAKAPIRVKFQLTSILPATSGKIELQLPSGEYAYGGNLYGFFRTYSTDFDYTQKEAYAISVSGTTLTVQPIADLPANTVHEVIITTDQASTPHFTVISTNGKTMPVTFENSGGIIFKQTINLYKYNPTPAVILQTFYYTSKYASDLNVLVLNMKANAAITVFSTSILEIELSSASGNLIQNGMTSSTRQLTCGVTGAALSTVAVRSASSAAAPKCIIVQSTTGSPKIRIENYAAMTSTSTFNIILYDLKNSIIPKDSVSYFDFVVVYTDMSTNARYKHKLTRAFTTTTGSSGASSALSSPTLSPYYYGAPTALSVSVTWPSGQSCSTNCRMVIRSSGTDWKFKDAANFRFQIDNNPQSVLLDLANNYFVLLGVTGISGGLVGGMPYTFSFTSVSPANTFVNPLPYQANSNSFTMQFSVNNQYAGVRTLALTSLYSALTSTPLTVSGVCTPFNGLLTGVSGSPGGNVECYIDVPLSSAYISMTAFQIDFPTTSQYSKIHNYCAAYVIQVSGTTTTTPGGQLTCSRVDASASSHSILVSGFSYPISSSSTIRVTFRARALSTTLSVDVNQYVASSSTSVYATSSSYPLSLSAAASSSYTSITSFQVQSFVPAPLAIASPGTKSPLRIVTYIGGTISAANSGYIQVTLGSGFPLNGLTVPQCSLRYESSYALPIITQCTYDSTNRIFKLTPVVDISTTGRYLITIGSLQSDLTSDGVTFPIDTTRVSAKVLIYSGTSTISADLIYIANIANSLYGFSISPQYNQVGSTSSQFELNFQPSSSVGADTTTDEVIFVLEFPTSLYDYDLGASTVTYAADGITYYNGVFLPSSGATSINLGTSTIATLHYGPSTQNPQVIISGHNGLLSSSSYTLSLGLIKNPAANKPQKVNFYVLSYSSGKAYATVLYQASYTNYYYTVPTAGETGSTPLWSFSSPYAQQTTNIILSTKTYGTIDANSKIYVKLLNQAKGFDYSAITGITCTGSVTYTVQWHKAGYIFYILPNGVVSSPPTITCSGFTLGTTIEDIWIETGIHRAGNYIYASKQLITMSVLNPMPGSGNSIATYDGTNTRNSVKRYTITVNTNTFILKAGGYLKFVMPSGLAVVPGLSEYIFVTGLTDKSTGSSPTSIQATIVSGNLIVTGYKDFSGSFKITMFLKNVLGGSNQIILWMYDQQGKNVAQANLNSIAVSTSTTDYTQGGSVVSMLTDTLDVWASERFRMTFKLGVANTYSYSSSSSFVITLPTGFSLLSGYEICKYKLTTSTLWIRSTCSISTQTISIPLVSGFNIAGGSVVDVRLTTENADYTQTGMDRPSTTNIRHIFNIRTQNPSSGSIEQVYIPFILYPKPTDLTFALTWYTRGSSDDAVVNVQFIPLVDLAATDFFELHLVSHDEITTVFPIDLGTGVTDNRVIGNCAEHPDYNTISNSANDLLGCYFQQGRTASYYPTKLVVRNEKAITASSTPTVRYLAAKLRNPGGIPGGFVINVMKPCRFDNYGCPIYRLRDYKSFGVSSPKTLTTTTRATPGSPLTYLLQDDSLTTFTFSLSNTVTPTDAIVVITNTVNIIIQDRCTSTGSNKCIHFPAIGWTWYQPGSNLNSGTSVSIQFTIDNAVYYDRTNPNDLFIEPNVNGGIQQIIQSPHPNYNVWVPTLATFPTQTDWNNPYIVRNFDNIIRISILGIWRTSLVRRIVVNTPSSYIDITSTYCQAGIELQDVGSTTWYEFPCQVTGPKQITLWINDPTRWTSTYALQNVRVYFRGFLPVNYATGLTTSSTITSYCDLTQPYVLDENTNYAFTISPTPTPIIRDVNLNLKSVNDRIAQISDYVMFYAAIWPNTPYGTGNPITQLLFEIDDEYAYPSLANLICMTKVVFKIQVSCTLKRQQGRTLIYVTPPPSYQNSPFLLTITNTAENLLFIAPDHEGSFRFNVTYLDASGNAVEKAESFMDIVGEYVQVFSAEPIRRDPDLKTLYDIQFTTATRVTPQGFAQSGQPVSTEIVLLFQTYSPAYPLDLGSGLADGSEMSCIAVTGLTFNIQKKLTCKLVYGLPTDHSLVKITGYDAIPAGTSVRIFIDDIITMPVAVTSRIQLEIRSTYAATGETFVFYNSLVVSPQKPTASTASSNPTWNVVRATGASAVLRERTTYTVSFTLTTQVNSGDYLIFDFPSYGYELESDYSNVVVVFQSSSYPCSSWVMPKTNRIYIQPQATLPTSGSLSFNIVNIQNPSFYLSGSYTFKLRAIVSQKLIDDYSSSFALTSTVCTLFSSEQIIYNSSYVRMNENTYQISFSVDHEVPAAGSLAIVFDPTKYNLRPSSPTCELVSGFNSLATCGFELFIQPLVRIKMNGQAMSAGTVVKVNIINVNNPTDNSALATITLQSYFDSAFGTTDTICSKSITLPAFQTLAAIKCPITLKPEVKNANTVTDYILTLSCSGDIRNATVVDVQFPAEFSNSFSSALSCSTNGNYMLDQCALIARTTRVTILVSKPSAQQALEIRIRNIKNPPGVMTYTTSVVNLLQYGVDYGAIDSTTSDIDITITSNDNLVKSDSKLALSIFPKNYGEKATYFFLLPGINVKQVPTDLILDFDTSFPTSLGSSIECGTFTPDSTFGKSYALNYETLNNYKGFSCEVSDDNKLTFTLSPTFTIQANKPYDLFFYVQGIINPSVNAQTSYSFNFLLTASGAAVFSSQNPISIAFALPPSLLQLKDFTTSDSNILAPATYTFTLQATTALPASTTTSIKEYELEVSLPSTLYPDFQQSVQVVYSFPDNPSIQSGSSAFNYENDLFFSASYPNLQTLGAFRLVLSNITNPSVESFCGLNAAGDPITFETQYVSRQKGFVYGRTYPISDQQNCLPLGKSRDAIKVISPLYLRKGLIYNITLQVEEAASDLYLTPISTFLTFEPKTVSFLNYQSRTVTLSVVVPTNVPKAEYLIQWKKRETGTHVNYLEVPDTRVIVVDETISTSTTPIPKVKVETITYVWTGTSPRDVLATLDIAPAEQLIVQIKSKTVDTKLKGSTDGITFTLFPISLTFNKGEASKKFYISASDGAKNNVLTYTISGTDVKSYDSRIADTPFSVQTQLSSTGFQVLSIQQVAVLENKVSYLASVSNIGTMFYMAVIESSFTPTKDQIISGQLSSINSQFYIAGSVDIQKIQYASSYSAYINITGLLSQTQYSIYFVARSTFGQYSDIKTYTFKTLKVSEGAILSIPSLTNITVSTLIDALSVILPVDKSRLIFSGANEYPAPVLGVSNQALGSQLNGYQITIAPDPNNNSPTPLEIANELQTQAKQDQLAALVPGFYSKAGVRVTSVRRISPRVIVTPSISQVGYYDMTVHAELIEVGKLFAIVTEKTTDGNVMPTSYQISQGLMANNQKLDDRYFKVASTTVNGDGNIVFDELRDYTQYNVYVTAGNDVPYDPVDILANSEVMRLEVQTLKNPTNNDSYYASANRILGLFWGTLLMLFAAILYI